MRSRLDGFVLLPRILDKGRATLAGKNGEYNYNSPTDQHLVRFLGLDLEALLKELVHRIISRRHTVGFKRVWMRGVSEEHIRCDT